MRFAIKIRHLRTDVLGNERHALMVSTTSKLLQAKCLRPLSVFILRGSLYLSVMFVVAIFPCATPSLGLRTVTESETPVDQDETSFEKDISLAAKARVGREQPGVRLRVLVRVGLNVSSAAARGPRAGHRLANNLLAPVRC